MHEGMARSQALNAAEPLRHARARPREIEVDDHGRLLQVDALADHVGRNQKVDRGDVAREGGVWCTVVRRELRERFSTSQRSGRDASAVRRQQGGSAVSGDSGVERTGRFRKLCERDDALARVLSSHGSKMLDARLVRGLDGALGA
jgi:hypothetical protein